MYLHTDEPMDFFNIYHPQKGGEHFPIFQANLGRQRGHGIGGIFQNLSRFLKPLFQKYVLPHAARAVRNAAVDIVDNNKPWRGVVQEQGISALKGIGHDILNQSGSGRGRKRKRKHSTKTDQRSKKLQKKSIKHKKSKKLQKKSIKHKKYKKSKKNYQKRSKPLRNTQRSIFDY